MLQSNHLTFNSFISYSSNFYILLNALLVKAMLLRCNSILRYSFAVPTLASRNPALAFLCVSTLLLCDSQQCAAIPLRLISVPCISIALHTFAFQFLYFTEPLTAFPLRFAAARIVAAPSLFLAILNNSISFRRRLL